MKFKFLQIILISAFLLSANITLKAQITITDKPLEQQVVFGNKKLKLTLDYNHKCQVTGLDVNGEAVISGKAGIFSEIRTSEATFSTRILASSPKIEIKKNELIIHTIIYGHDSINIRENWKFILTETDINLEIERTVSKPFVAEEVSFPSIHFNSINTWTGAFLEYGGLAWFYLFNEKLCTYGVHSGSSAFWNSATGNGLNVSASSPGKFVVSKFSRSNEDELAFSFSVSDQEMKFRYDSLTYRRRFIRQKTDVWDKFKVSAGTYRESVNFSWLNYKDDYNRGNLVGINGSQVSSLLNTIARIGVIDAKHFGGNSWHTPYGPICLHEQYIAEMGLAINDKKYLDGYKQCLDFYRDKVILPDGRVIARWAYDNSDAMAGTATPEGFYEAQWGYLLDSNPDFVINVTDLYHQCGDLDWVRKQKNTCEMALEYLLKRDSDGNHLVEMMTDSHSQRKGSDWIDIIWASYENAFVNAELYHALVIWSEVEKQLGDTSKSDYYSSFASKLKTSFNKSTNEGGFWDEKNKWYVHWLDKDHSVHGNNLVTPVNFMAIAYGICDDETRRKAILDKIEEQMQAEKLFAWPLCMYTYAKGEGNDWQFPFPNYENGDIFLSWGALGVEAYAGYKPEIALKYIDNILERYEKDGLAFQRYGRNKQDGLGDDILAGNSLAIVGLYKSIYGINPLYNRIYLNPHLPQKLSGTELNYNFRGNKLKIRLEKDKYSITDGRFMLTSSKSFGFNADKSEMEYFNSDHAISSLKAMPTGTGNISIEVISCDENEIRWNQVSSIKKGEIKYTACNLKPDNQYIISQEGRKTKILKSNGDGSLHFDSEAGTVVSQIRIQSR